MSSKYHHASKYVFNILHRFKKYKVVCTVNINPKMRVGNADEFGSVRTKSTKQSRLCET